MKEKPKYIPKNGRYIQCYVSNGTISPQGNGKSKEYAQEVIANYKKFYPLQPWKLYKLIEVKDEI